MTSTYILRCLDVPTQRNREKNPSAGLGRPQRTGQAASLEMSGEQLRRKTTCWLLIVVIFNRGLNYPNMGISDKHLIDDGWLMNSSESMNLIIIYLGTSHSMNKESRSNQSI
jgi:hypothetical protein